MKKKISNAIWIVPILIGGVVISVVAWGWQMLRPVSKVAYFQLIYVPSGSTTGQVGSILRSRGVIRSRAAFVWYTRLTGRENQVWAGYYQISPHFPLPFVVKILTEFTPYSRLIRVTIPEGYSLIQIAKTLETAKLTRSDRFIEYVTGSAKLELLPQFPWMVMIPTRNLEGLLYPNTYLFSPVSTDRAIVKVFLQAFSNGILKEWDLSSGNARLSFYNTLVMASLVEKEARVADEMPQIAGVFYNRLDKNMPLASDPTIVYALGVPWKPVVLYKDLKIDSPYNTYKRRGLPPTPIGSPGLAAFKAALEPASGNYLFFVALPSGNGRHVFTRTYREHIAAQR